MIPQSERFPSNINSQLRARVVSIIINALIKLFTLSHLIASHFPTTDHCIVLESLVVRKDNFSFHQVDVLFFVEVFGFVEVGICVSIGVWELLFGQPFLYLVLGWGV